MKPKKAQYIVSMENTIYIRADFACVYLLNGTFSESADGFSYPTDQPLYVTVLPLSAHLLPYTVKIASQKPLSNEKLCAVFMDGDKLLVKLSPRYNYIYTIDDADAFRDAGQAIAEQLFYAVKQKDFARARKFLSEELSASIDDTALEGFFSDYTQILRDDFSSPRRTNAYYLITHDGKGELFVFDARSGLIDDITGKE